MLIGKIIGGIIGAFAAGPGGFFVGAALGHAADVFMSSQKKSVGRAGLKESDFKSGHMLFVEFACQGAAKIAKAKGFIHSDDIHELERIFAELNFDATMRKRAISYFRSAKESDYSLVDIARTFAAHFPTKNARLAFFNILVRVAVADHKLDHAEAAQLRSVARVLHISTDIIDELEGRNGRKSYQSSNNGGPSRSSRNHSSMTEEYAILGVSHSASLAEIKTAYRNKCKELHPDILRSKGIGNYAMKVIEEELRKINDAYDKIIKSRS